MAGQQDLDLVRINVGDSERTKLYKEMLKSNSNMAAGASEELRKSTDRLKNGGNSRIGTPAAFVGRVASSEVKKEGASLSRCASAGSVRKSAYDLERLKSTVRRDGRCVAHVPELEPLLRSTAARMEALCKRLERADEEALVARQLQLRKETTVPAHNIQLVRRGNEAPAKERRSRVEAAALAAVSKNITFSELDLLDETLSEASFLRIKGKKFGDRVPPFQGLDPELLTLTEALEKAQQWEKDGCAGFCFEGDPTDESGEELKLEVSFRAAPESGKADNWPETSLESDESWTTYERKGTDFKHLREFFKRTNEPHPYLPLLHDHALVNQANFQKAIWGEPCLPTAESGLRAADGPRGPNITLPRVKPRGVTPPLGRRMRRDKSVWF